MTDAPSAPEDDAPKEDSEASSSLDDEPSEAAPPEEEAAPGDASSSSRDLTLPEALLMLALGDEEGRVELGKTSELPFGLTAAVLLTLASRDRIRHEDDVWRVDDDTPTGDPSLDPALQAMAGEEEPRGTMHWLRALTKAEKGEALQERLLRRLTDDKILRREKHAFLGLFTYYRYPTEDPNPEQRVRALVRKAVLEGDTPDDRILALTALMDACNLTDEVFSYEERKEAADRLDDLTERARVASAISAVNEETVVAVLTATTAATTTATKRF